MYFHLNKYFINIYARAFNTRRSTKQQHLYSFYLVISILVVKTILYFHLDELGEIITREMCSSIVPDPGDWDEASRGKSRK